MSLLSRDPTRISTFLNTDKLQTKKLEIHVLKLTQYYMFVKYITTVLGHSTWEATMTSAMHKIKDSSSLLTPKIHYRLH